MLQCWLKHSPRGRKCQDVIDMLSEAPEQKCNSEDAFAGKVFEVAMSAQADAKAGTLSEVAASFSNRSYRINCEDGHVDVSYDGNIFTVQ